jgi:hypothetical protein
MLVLTILDSYIRLILWCLQPRFQKPSTLGLFEDQLKQLIGNNVPSSSKKDIFYKLFHSYKMICDKL